MSFRQLCDQPERIDPRALPPRPGAPWVFIHIPKTAGSTLREQLAIDGVPPCHLDKPMPKSPTRPVPDQGPRLARFIADGGLRANLTIASHIEYHTWHQFGQDHPQIRFFTFLRDPLARVLSDFRYQSTPRHPLHEQFRRRFPDIEAFAHHRGAQNRAFRNLALDREEKLDAVIARIEDRFAFVGTQERFDACFAVLMRLMGKPVPDDPVPVVNPTTSQDDTPELDPALASMIRDNNALDAALHRHFSRRLEGVLARERLVPPAPAPRPARAAGLWQRLTRFAQPR